jgi:hypothetical protein
MSDVRIAIDTSLTAQLAAIFTDRKVAFAYLFGSQARNDMGPLSDIDIAVCFDETIPSEARFDRRLEVLGELTDLFKTDDVDLVVLNDAPPLLTHRILRDGRLLFSADERSCRNFELRAMLKYLDWKPRLERYTCQTLGPGAGYDR